MTDDQLQPYVNACTETIVNTRQDYLTPTQLGASHKPLRALSESQKFRVCVLLCKSPLVSVAIGPHGGFQFYPRHRAPDGAFNIGERHRTAGEIILKAGDHA